jgi:uncharacterized protein (TIGR01589 family)
MQNIEDLDQKFINEQIKILNIIIEKCLLIYLPEDEIIEKAKEFIKEEYNSEFISIVWEKFKNQNQDFIFVYNQRIFLKEQIELYNLSVKLIDNIEKNESFLLFENKFNNLKKFQFK